MFKEDTLAGKCGLITGGTSGIGLAMAQYLARHGAKLSITGRDAEKAEAAAKTIQGEVLPLVGDVREAVEVNTCMQAHMDTYGRIDFLINNAAGNFLCPLEKMSENAFMSVINIVTKGTFLFSKAALAHMKAAKSGKIINIGTTYANSQASYVGHSGAAKAGTMNMTRTMAVEWGPYGIQTNMIAPGPVKDTEGVRRLLASEEMGRFMHRIMPTPRMAEGWEIGALALFLLSDMGNYINGAVIPVDGGLHLTVPGLLPAGMPMP